jgi:ferredoxin
VDFKNDRDKLFELANLMNEQSETPIPMVTDDLLYIFDVALEPEEVEFLLKMGGGNITLPQIESKMNLSKSEFDRIFENLLDKGHITQLESEEGKDEAIYHLMTILPGWFELYLMRGAETPDRKAFSERLSMYYGMAADFDPEIINAILREVGPQRSIAVANPPKSRLINIGEAIQPQVSEVFPPHSVVEIINQLDENEVITLGHCFCRQQRKLVGDPCRVGLPEESCIAIGPAAEHLLTRNFARQITKKEALELIREVEEKGVIHQVGRVLPLKDLKTKYDVDIICNCCWDCCGVAGNYHRGNTPFVLKSYYIAEIPDQEICNGCGTCEEYCPVQAISLNGEGKAEINPDMCCGCGMCAIHCTEEAIHLEPLEREVFLPMLPKSERRITK